MPLRKMQVKHFIRFGFGADDSDEAFFLFSRPGSQSLYIGQNKREIVESYLLQGGP